MEHARDKQHGGETNTGAKHGNPPDFIFFDRKGEKATGRDRWRPAAMSGDQKILIALSSVFHTPQASGIPTKAQNSAALASSPPLPMPNEPCWIAASLFALADCSLATSSVLMCHLWSTGLIR